MVNIDLSAAPNGCKASRSGQFEKAQSFHPGFPNLAFVLV
jgi:hypothetical protein